MRRLIIVAAIVAVLCLPSAVVAGPGKWKQDRATGVKKVKIKGKRRDIKQAHVTVKVPSGTYTFQGPKYAQ